MVEIKKIIKSNKAILCFVAFLLVLTGLFADFFIGAERLSPAPSHIVLSKWNGENNRRAEITFKEFKKEKLVHTKLGRIPFSQTKFIINTNNLRFSLFTKGKIIFKNTNKRYDGFGSHIHIIDISDIKPGSELYLFLSPVKGEKGRIESDIYLTATNDFLLELICKNKSIIMILILVFAAAFLLFIAGIFGLIKKKKTAPRAIFLSCCLVMFAIIILFKSDIKGFFINSGIVQHTALYSSYSLLGVFVSAFLCSALKINSRITDSLSVLIIAYSVLRVILFLAFLIPLSRLVFLSHILLLLSVITPIILKLCRKSRQSFILLFV